MNKLMWFQTYDPETGIERERELCQWDEDSKQWIFIDSWRGPEVDLLSALHEEP
jgi:hypothetical protein